MNIFNYTAEISGAETLFNSLVSNGVDMDLSTIRCIPEYSLGVATGATNIEIVTDSIESACANSVSGALVGTLQSNKQKRKTEVSEKSSELGKQGLTHTTASGSLGVFPIENSKEELSFYSTVADALISNPSEAPQIIPTIDGGGVAIMNPTEATTLSDDARHRMEYIYSSVSINSDSSKSQLLLEGEIDAASTQAALDSIIDSRA